METQERHFKYGELFSPEDKTAAFDMVAEQFYERNFGRMTKSDFETLMFNLYIERCMKTGKCYDDYTLSKELGITQSRVRSLKVKAELQYPSKEFKWENRFVERIPFARYDKGLVKVHIPDVNVLMELRNYIEQRGWYDEYQLNPKLFQCKLDVFVELCNSFEDTSAIELEENVKKKLKKLQRECEGENEQSALNRIISGDIKGGLKELAVTAGKDIFIDALGLIPFGGLAGTAFKYLTKVIEKAL